MITVTAIAEHIVITEATAKVLAFPAINEVVAIPEEIVIQEPLAVVLHRDLSTADAIFFDEIAVQPFCYIGYLHPIPEISNHEHDQICKNIHPYIVLPVDPSIHDLLASEIVGDALGVTKDSIHEVAQTAITITTVGNIDSSIHELSSTTALLEYVLQIRNAIHEQYFKQPGDYVLLANVENSLHEHENSEIIGKIIATVKDSEHEHILDIIQGQIIANVLDSIHETYLSVYYNAPTRPTCDRYLHTPYEESYIHTPYEETYLSTPKGLCREN